MILYSQTIPYISEPNTTPIPDIENFYISTLGVEKLLIPSNVKKVIGPNLLANSVFKKAVHELVSILQVIFQASIDRLEVPKDFSTS